jgi:hypothetical protein
MASSEHLLKHTERIRGQVHERLNIIFIAPHYISRPVPHDPKLVDRELDNYSIELQQGITTLYLRKICASPCRTGCAERQAVEEKLQTQASQITNRH